jgi:hypothetical protein
MSPPPYVKIVANQHMMGNVKAVKFNESSNACNCDPNGNDPCGPDSNCINRFVLEECDANLCPCGLRCQNQKFQKREYPNVLPFPTPGRGWGLKAGQNIKNGGISFSDITH